MKKTTRTHLSLPKFLSHKLQKSLWMFLLLIVANAMTIADTDSVSDSSTTVPAVDPLDSLAALTKATAQRMHQANQLPELTGSGPFPAQLEMDLAYPSASTYRPAELSAFDNGSLGVLIWGNGGCSNDGASARAHLAEIASYGYLVIAPGKALTGPLVAPGLQPPQLMQITIEHMRDALDWALSENDRAGSPYHNKIDTNAVAVAGHSCGGMLAILLGEDPRIRTVIIHNSGIFPVLPDNPPLVMHESRLKGLHTPVLIITGGKTDLAAPLARQAFASIDHVTVFMASKDVGHEGTFDQAHGGDAAKLAVNWLQWQLRGDYDSQRFFIEEDCRWCSDSQWTLEQKIIAE